MRLAVILPSMAGGGMERVQVNLIREWVQRGIDVDLVVSRFQGPLCEEVPETVRVFEVARFHSTVFPFGLHRYLRTRRPSHILSAANDINAVTLLVARGMGENIQTVISVHGHLSRELAQAKGMKRLKARAVKWTLGRVIHLARGVVAVSKGVADDLKLHFPFRENQLHVIHNPVITPATRQRLKEPLKNSPVPNGTPWMLYAGRFVPAKGLDVLMDAFELMADRTSAHLVLMGDGPIKSAIAGRAAANGLGERIHLVDFQLNPLPWMREAEVLVLSSRHEGLGNVLIEALACGTQIVATDCPAGPAEILDGGRYGQLVPVEDTEALAKALLRSLDRHFYVAPARLQERAALFSSEQAATLYLAVLEGAR